MVNYRRNKLESSDAFYFLTLVTRDRGSRFRSREDFLEVGDTMEFVRERFSVAFLAWVLLVDYLDWLICPHEAGEYAEDSADGGECQIPGEHFD